MRNYLVDVNIGGDLDVTGTGTFDSDVSIDGDLTLLNSGEVSTITLNSVPSSNYIKSNGYTTNFGIRGNAGNGQFILENLVDTYQFLSFIPSINGWELNVKKELGASGKLEILAEEVITNSTIHTDFNNPTIDSPWLKLGNHNFFGNFNGISIQSDSKVPRISLDTQLGSIEVFSASGNSLRLSSSDYGLYGSSGDLNLGIIQHNALSNNYGKYLSINNGISSSGVRGIVNVNGDLRINDYSNGTSELKITLGNDGKIAANSIKLTTGSTDGYFLKSDADGNGSWQPIAASQVYKGTWDANINTPDVTSGSPVAGWYYRCTTAGTYNSVAYSVGDDIIYNGTTWERIPSQGYTLQTATSSVLGGVKIGSGVDISSGVISVTNISGNSGTATTLQTARTIAGVSFNGSANIELDNANIANGANYITGYSVTESDVTQYESDLSISTSQITGLNYYTGWDLLVDGINRGAISSSEDVNFIGGTDIEIVYSSTANGLTFNYTGSGTGSLSTEQVQDIVGAMVSGNTESGISVTYDDTTGTLDFNNTSSTFTPTSLAVDYGFTDNSANWNTAYGWGDHDSAGYALSSEIYEGWDLYLDGTYKSRLDSRENVNFVGGTDIDLSYSSTNNTITINSTASSGGTTSTWDLEVNGILKSTIDDNDYVNFSSGTGINLSGSGSTVTIDVDVSVARKNVSNTFVEAVTLEGTNVIKGADFDGDDIDGVGTVTAIDFVKSGSSNSYVLLGGGGHVLLSSLGGGSITNYLKDDANDSTTGSLTATNFILSSDKRLKTNIKNLEPNHIPVKWKSFNLKQEDHIYRTGVIAQELELTNPEFVNTDSKGMKSVKYIDLLISVVHELEGRIKELESK